MNSHISKKQNHLGFTIVELLIVIVVIAILATISIVAYNGIQERARNTQMANDLALLEKAVQTARVSTNTTLLAMTGSSHTGGVCFTTENTYPAALDKSHSCWTRYYLTLTNISNASGMNLDSLRKGDPWGAPYYIDENEGENYSSQGLCRSDIIGVYTNPLPASRDGYGLANGGTTGYNWLKTNRIIRAGVNSC